MCVVCFALELAAARSIVFATNQVSSECDEGEDAQQQEFGASPTMVVQGRVDVVSTCPSRGNQVDGLPRATSSCKWIRKMKIHRNLCVRLASKQFSHVDQVKTCPAMWVLCLFMRFRKSCTGG